MPRRIILAAIGGRLHPPQLTAARDFGGAVARAGCILLTGGVPAPTDLQDADKRSSSEAEADSPAEFFAQVKNATMSGAVAAASAGQTEVAARLIGILPSTSVEWTEAPGRLLLRTGLHHTQRNVVNGLTPDVVVVFGGSTGTLSELTYAVVAKKPVVYCDAVAMLRERCEVHSRDGELLRFYREALACFPTIAGAERTPDELLSCLRTELATARDHVGELTTLVHRAVAAVGSDPPPRTGFPGIPSDAASQGRFEAAVERISS